MAIIRTTCITRTYVLRSMTSSSLHSPTPDSNAQSGDASIEQKPNDGIRSQSPRAPVDIFGEKKKKKRDYVIASDVDGAPPQQRE